MAARSRSSRAIIGLAIAVCLAIGPIAAAARDTGPGAVWGAPGLDQRGWIWPLTALRVVREYQAPAHAYGPGHRGIDLVPLADAEVRTPQSGVVAFAGEVAGRPVLTIDHGDGLVTTLEPVITDVAAGAAVGRGDVVGIIGAGGHATAGTVHFGVRLHGEYVNPLLLLGGLPRAVLLPCCE